MLETTVSKPLYRAVASLTQEPRLDVALPLIVKDLIHFRLRETAEQRARFENQYGMDFAAFQKAWNADLIPDRYSYNVERDYWEWEAIVTDEVRLQAMIENLL